MTLASTYCKKSIQDMKTFVLRAEEPTKAARERLELLNTVHQRVHKLEFIENLREEFQPESTDSTRKSLRLLKSTHEKIHRLWLSELSKAGLGPDGRLNTKWLRKLESDYLLDDFVAFRVELQTKFKFSRNEQTEGLIFEIIDATATLGKSIEDRLQKRGFAGTDLLYDYLFAAYNYCNDRPLQDCFEPRKDENGLSGYGELIASEILMRMEAERQTERREVNRETKGLLEELGQLSPPLTWGEVLFRFIEDDVSAREKLDELFFPPGRRYCFVCDKPFLLSKNNPGYFRCPRCSARMRQRRKRERESKILEKG